MLETNQEPGFMTVEDVMKILQVKEAKAYEIIRALNKELRSMGYVTIRGRVDANYFRKKMFYAGHKEVKYGSLQR